MTRKASMRISHDYNFWLMAIVLIFLGLGVIFGYLLADVLKPCVG